MHHNFPAGTNSPLADFVSHIHPVKQEVIQYINKHSFPHFMRRGEVLIRPGEYSSHLYLICKGAVRAYMIEGSKEITTWICAENEIITSIRGFLLREPAVEYIEAIEDCELAGASYDTLQYLYQHHIEMNVMGRKLLEQYYGAAEERNIISRLTRAESKYNYFVERNGHLLNRIPLKIIASYLGMTTETLSRIRKRISKPPKS